MSGSAAKRFLMVSRSRYSVKYSRINPDGTEMKGVTFPSDIDTRNESLKLIRFRRQEKCDEMPLQLTNLAFFNSNKV